MHRCAGDGTVAAGSDAPDVSYAVSLSRRSVPRVTYVTLADELRVAEAADLSGGPRDSSGPDAGTADAGATMNRDELASAAGGKRGGGNSRSVERGGVYMDQLHVSMRAAMRPADWARAADFRTRRVEEGSRIVAAPPGSVNVVLQMPRGNLETVHPRSLALPAVTAALAAGRFTAAATRGSPSRGSEPARGLRLAELPEPRERVRRERERSRRRHGAHRGTRSRGHDRAGGSVRASSRARRRRWPAAGDWRKIGRKSSRDVLGDTSGGRGEIIQREIIQRRRP